MTELARAPASAAADGCDTGVDTGVDTAADTAAERPPRALRKDAERNRLRIVDAAREALAEHGVEVPMEEVARRAGVGVGTLYRRFPSRQDLIEAVFLCKAHGYLQVATDALAAPDGWTGFTTYLTRLCEQQAQDRSVSDVLTLTMRDCPEITRIRDELYHAQLALIRRAQHEGSLRADLVPEDMILLLLAHGGVAAATEDAAPGAWRRALALMLDALRAPAAGSTGEPRPPLPPAPPPAQLLAAFREPRPGRRPGSVARPVACDGSAGIEPLDDHA